jgi:tetratricopeptide (TPR) repeat protein
MKKLLYILLLLSQISWAQSAFEQGNDLYRKGNYAEAIKRYESILKEGQESAELYFNMGNAYYKLNKTAPAIYNLEKALLLKPNDEDIKANLAFTQKMTVDDAKPVTQSGFAGLMGGSQNYDRWAWVAVITCFIFFSLFLGYYMALTSSRKRLYFIGMAVAVVVIVITLPIACMLKSIDAAERPAIIFANQVAVKSEPLATASAAFTLHEGTKVNVIDTLENWKKIELSGNQKGWVEAGAIKEVK